MAQPWEQDWSKPATAKADDNAAPPWERNWTAQPAKAEDTGNVGRGFKEAFQQVPQLGYGLLAGTGAAIESAFGEGGIGTGLKKAGVKGYTEWGDKIAAGSKESDSFDYSWDRAKEGDIGALGAWIAHGLGYAGGQAVQMLATAGLGAVAGKATLGTVAKSLAEGMVQKEAAALAATDAAKSLTAEQVTKLATQAVASKLGQTAAIGASAFGMEGGEIFGDLTQEATKEGKTLTGEQLAKAFGATLAAGGLEFVGDKVGLDVMLGKSKLLKPAEAVTGMKGRAARAGVAALGAAPIEGATEYGQTLLEEAGKGHDPFSDDALKQAKDAAALGALGGAAMGGVGGALQSAKPKATASDVLAAPTIDEAANKALLAISGPTKAAEWEVVDGTLALPGPAAQQQPEVLKALPGPDGQPVFMADDKGNVSVQPAAARVEALNRGFDAQQAADAAAADAMSLGKQAPVGLRPSEQPAPAVPVGEATEVPFIPTGEATEVERIPTGEASELLPTGEATEVPRKIATGKASEPDAGLVETIHADDLLTGDGVPYGSKVGANIRAKREGLTPDHVVEIPGAGWVIRPNLSVRSQSQQAPINAQPNNTRGTTAADVIQGPRDANRTDVGGNPGRGAADGGAGTGAGSVVQGQQPEARADGLAPGTGSGADERAGAVPTGPGRGNDALKAGAVFTLDGKQWTVQEVKDSAIAVRDAENNTRMVARNSKTFQKITAALQPAPELSSADPRREPASWVIREKETGKVVMETFDRSKVDALNMQKYEAVPVMEHLQSLNENATNSEPAALQPAATAPEPAAAETNPQPQGAQADEVTIPQQEKQVQTVAGALAPAAQSKAPRSMMKPGFDSDAWQKGRDDRIKASREAGNTHLDQIPAYVETMRGKEVYYVHDPKVRGRILTVDNNGNVYVEWLDKYSQDKEGATPMKMGKREVMQSSLGPRDLKDYVAGKPAEAAPQEPPKAEKPQPTEATHADPGEKPEAVTPAESEATAQPAQEAEPKPAEQPAPAEAATTILDAAGVTGKERLDALKDVKAGTVTPEELAAAYPAPRASSLNKRHSIPARDVLTPGGALSADATSSRADSAVWYYQGDMNRLRFDASVVIDGKPAEGAERAKRALARIKAVQDAGWQRRNYRAGRLGTVWVFEREGQFLTRAGFENAAAEPIRRPVLSEDRAGFLSMARQQFELAKAFDAWLNTLPDDQQENRGLVSRKIGETPVGDWARIEADEAGVSLRYYDPGATRFRIAITARSWEELRAYVRELAAHADEAADITDENAIGVVLRKAARDAGADAPGTMAPAGWVFAADWSPSAGVDAEVSRLNALDDGNEYRAHMGGIIQRKREAASPLDAAKAVMREVYDGKASVETYQAGYRRVRDDEAGTRAALNKLTKDQLIRQFGIVRDGNKAELVDIAYGSLLRGFALGKEYGPNSYIMSSGGLAAHEAKKREALDALVAGQTAEDLAAYAAEIAKQREAYAARVDAARKAVENPKTLEDFRRFMSYHTRDGKTTTEVRRTMLTPEQRAEFDRLLSAESRSGRKATAEVQKTRVAVAGQKVDGDIIATKHTRKGHDIYVVRLAERVSREDYDTLNAGAKRIGGYYSSFKGTGAVPGFQFTTREQAEAFRALANGDNTAAVEAAKERRDAFEDDRSQSAVERLNEMADRLQDRADESMGRERKANTARRARFAAAAEQAASADKALATTMRNIATAIGNGTASMLDRVRQKVQVEYLRDVVQRANDDMIRERSGSYAEYERNRGAAPTQETADFATFPEYTAMRSDLASLGRQLLETEGTKALGQRLMKVADDVSDAFTAWVKDAGNFSRVAVFSTQGTGQRAGFATKDAAEIAIIRSGYRGRAIPWSVKRGEWTVIMSPSEAMNKGIWQGDGDKRITLSDDFGAELVEKIGRANRRGARVSVPWVFESTYDRRKMLGRMGIETPAEFRTALREFIALQERPEAPSRVKELERALIGRRNDGFDFFPTPEGTADEMVAAADIQPGMRVLEPSGGMGHIADRIRAAGAEPDVVEIEGDKRDLLEAKGYNLVGRDFLDTTDGGYDRIVMNPPFSNGRDIEHVRHAYGLLKPGGRLVAIMGESAFNNQNKRATEFRDWLDEVGGTSEKLAEGTFLDPSLPVNTGANARMVVIEKPAAVEAPKDSTLTREAIDRATLSADETAALESEYGAKNGTEPFHARLAQDVSDYITKGAEAISSAIRSIVGKVAKAVLSFAVVVNLAGLNPHFSSDSYARAVPAMPRAVTVTQTVQFKQEGKADTNGRTLSPGAAKVVNWIGAQNRPSEVSLILDPAVGRLYVMRGGKIEADAPALYGKQGVAAITDRILNAGVDETTDDMKVTPAGVYPANMVADHEYGSRIDFLTGPNAAYAIHRVYLGDAKERRQQRLDSTNPADNGISFGCVNVSNEFYDKTLRKLNYKGDAYVYLLPSDASQLDALVPMPKPLQRTESQTVAEDAGRLDTEPAPDDGDPLMLGRRRADQRGARGRREEGEGATNGEAPKFSRATDTIPLDQSDAIGREFWRKIDNGETFTEQEVLNALSINRRGSRRDARSLEVTPGGPTTGESIVHWSGEIAGFDGYRTSAAWVADSFTVFVIPEELAAGADLSDSTQARDRAIVAYAFTPLRGGIYELAVNDVAPDSTAENALRERGKLQDAGIESNPYRRVDIGHTLSRALLQESIRRLALNIGQTPSVYYAQRDTGARAGQDKSGRGFNAERIERNFSRSGRTGRGISITDAEAIAADIRATMPTAPQIVVVESVSQLPDKLRALIEQAGADNDVEGVYWGGKVYAVTAHFSDLDRFRFVVAHHELRHHGFGAMLGPRLHRMMMQIYRSNAKVRALADQNIRDGIAKDVVVATEEALADMPVEDLVKLRGWQRIVAAVREFLRNLAMKLEKRHPKLADMLRPDGWTDEDIARLISRAEDMSRTGEPDYVRGGAVFSGRATNGAVPADTNAPGQSGDAQGADSGKSVTNIDTKIVDADGRPLVVFHGTRSPSDFAEFSHAEGEKIGRWNSDADAGLGFHFSADPEIAAGYGRVGAYFLKIKNPKKITEKQVRRLQDEWLRDLKNAADRGDEDAQLTVEKIEMTAAFDNPDSGYYNYGLRLAIDDAIDRGNDGLIFTRSIEDGEGEVDEYIAFRPDQIIRATKPNDQSAPDSDGAPRFSRARPNVTTATAPSAMAEALQSFGDTKLPGDYIISDFIQSHGKLSWWDKTVGSMHNLAQRNPLFKPVYDRAQDFLNAVSTFATEAADLAPTLLPKLEGLRDLGKSPLSAEDTKAISAPIFEGTLLWTRDENGQIVREEDPQKAGVVWRDDELRGRYGLNDHQIKLYREFRAATNKSLTDMTIADMIRFGGADVLAVRDRAMALGDVTAAGNLLAEHLTRMADEDSDRAGVLIDTAGRIMGKAEQAVNLMSRGYAPLTRFGHYTLDVTDAGGQRVYFGLFESQAEANRFARKMRAAYPDGTIQQGTLSQEAYKMFAGISPETAELFGQMLGLEAQGDDAASQAFQEYLKLAKSNRSAMKRLIERKGIAGFSEDAGRVLAGFVYSNARQAAKNLHMGAMNDAVQAIAKAKGKGELLDTAVRLHQYIANPVEEAQKIKGMMFTQFLGGSLAAGLVNLSQVPMVTFPYLSQFGGAAKAAANLKRGLSDALKWETAKTDAQRTTGDAALDKALKRAEEDGIVSPQEIHSLIAQANGSGALKAGDGTKAGNLAAKGSNFLSKLGLVWGKPFAIAEQFNRRATFIAAYRTAVEQSMPNPAQFAEQAVTETQFSYTRANRPEWARGALGSVLFTFKTYSISYVELLYRMAKSGPEGKKAALLALGVMFLMAGMQGLPGADDLDDIIDGIMQRLGYNFSSKQAKREFFAKLMGEGGAQFMMRGVSGLPGAPIDVANRLGLGNLIPGTGLLTKKADHTSDVTEIGGPALSFGKQLLTGADQLTQGNFGKAVESVLPVAAANAWKAIDMASSGMYRDQLGRKVIDTDGYDALVKAIGFQPNDVSKVQTATREVQQMVGLNKMREAEIADQWAQAIFDNDTAGKEAARQALDAWNRDNPESPIKITTAQLLKRLKAMREDKMTRIEHTAPKEIRATVHRELAEAR